MKKEYTKSVNLCYSAFMSISYQQQNTLFPDPDGPRIEVITEVPGGGKVKIPVPVNHPLVVLSRNIDWELMFGEIDPIIYRTVNKSIGRKLNLRAHCGIYLLQAMNNWTDRFSEEMLRYYAPARIFCGYDQNSEESIDHTKIEKFRNRLGKEGAEVMGKYLLKLAVKDKFTNGKDIDMDTTVQEAGIAYPTEMNLMKKFRERVIKIAGKIFGSSSAKVEQLKEAGKKAQKLVKEYTLFTKDRDRKRELVEEARGISMDFLKELAGFSPLKEVENLRPYLKKEMNHLLEIMPRLLEQIGSWLETGNVAKGKILSLYKSVPKFISKGKIGKAKEIGRKWIINQCAGGFLLLICPDNPTVADTDCVKTSLEQSIETFGETPQSYGTDRGMDSKENIAICKAYGVEKIGIQPRGRKEWQVDPETASELYCRRAAIEPRIGIAGRLGLKKSRARTDDGDIISGYRAGIGFNLKKMMHLWRIQSA